MRQLQQPLSRCLQSLGQQTNGKMNDGGKTGGMALKNKAFIAIIKVQC
jgi:hypothetical protein